MSFELKVLLLSIAVTVYLIVFNTLQHRNLSFSGNSTRCSVKVLTVDSSVSLKEVFRFLYTSWNIEISKSRKSDVRYKPFYKGEDTEII